TLKAWVRKGWVDAEQEPYPAPHGFRHLLILNGRFYARLKKYEQETHKKAVPAKPAAPEPPAPAVPDPEVEEVKAKLRAQMEKAVVAAEPEEDDLARAYRKKREAFSLLEKAKALITEAEALESRAFVGLHAA